jgi:hypothetical protein
LNPSGQPQRRHIRSISSSSSVSITNSSISTSSSSSTSSTSSNSSPASLHSSHFSKCKKTNLFTSICNSDKNFNNIDDYDKDYEYDNHDESENNNDIEKEEEEEDNFTNDIDLKYDQEHSNLSLNRKENIYAHSQLSSHQLYQKETTKQFNLNTSSENSSIISRSRSSSSCSSCSSKRSVSSNSNSRSSEIDSETNVSDDEDDAEYNSEKLYDYEDDTYFDKYDYDINSNCCKISSENTNLNYAVDFNNLNKQMHMHQPHSQPDIDTIIKSISSLTVDSIPADSIRQNTLTTSLNTTTSKSSHTNSSSPLKCKYKSINHLIYEKLNGQRLELVDLLLKHGADKYLVTKLSITNLKRLDKKSFNMMKKWYGISKTTTSLKSKVSQSNRLKFSLDPSFTDDGDDDKKDSETDPTEEESEDEEDEEEEDNEENVGQELRPLSPMLASLCLDDVEIFSRLYKHHQTLFTYFKPDEDYELIYYAIRFQSKKCLIYLLCTMNSDLELPTLLKQHTTSKLATSLSLPMSLNKAATFNQRSVKSTMTTSSLKLSQHATGFQQQINKNVNTMFYIIENTRSSEIVKVLLKCGFDLCKREPHTGNTTLHCLFNASANSPTNMCTTTSTTTTANSQARTGEKKSGDHNNNNRLNKTTHYLTARKILDEFRTPKSLSKILFIMLKHGGLKSHVNTLNYEKKLCLQNLFEWSELIETVFFESNMKSLYKSETSQTNYINRSEWQKEFKECVRLLLKSGADLLLLNTSTSSTYAMENECELITHNCIQTLISSILKNSIHTESHDPQTDKFQLRFYNKSNGSDMGDILHSNTTTLNDNTAKKGAAGLALNLMRQRSPSLPLPPDRSLLAQIGSNMGEQNAHHLNEDCLAHKKKKFELNKTIDIEFMYHLFNEVIDLAGKVHILKTFKSVERDGEIRLFYLKKE